MSRSISHSEASSLLDCQAQWDFRYGGHLAGTALEPKTTRLILREGRAWGAAMAALHGDGPSEGLTALVSSLDDDAEQMRAHGIHDEDVHRETTERLIQVFDHYAATAELLTFDRAEHEMEVAVRSRHGRRASPLYRYLARIDGVHTDEHGEWIVEFKLRGELSDLAQVVLSRQIRWYAWVWREATGREPVGVIVDERRNEAPREPRVNKDGKPSHDKSQLVTLESYLALCASKGVEPSEDAVEAFRTRRWQAQHRVFLEADELDEAGVQLTSMARLVGLLDVGTLYPVRNPSKFRCPGCAFRDICNEPTDAALVDALYTRVPAKRDRMESVA